MRKELAYIDHPAVMVIFGITGDLSRRKLLPAIYHLIYDDLLPEHFQIFGLTRKDLTAKDLAHELFEFIDEKGSCDLGVIQEIEKRLTMVKFDINNPEDYLDLRGRIVELEKTSGKCFDILHYLAVPPKIIDPIVTNLGEANLNIGCSEEAVSRLLIEKPFGFDLESAETTNRMLKKYFREDYIYRIDHYMAKETAQNILSFRFKNPILRGIWNNRHVRHIQITAAEMIDIEGRATFYEQTGALRDMLQSHLLQLLSLVTMEEPSSTSGFDIAAARAKVLQEVMPLRPENVIRGQYEGYRDDVDNQDSLTETYIAAKVEIENEHWNGVPILLRAGKSMAEKLTTIVMYFDDYTRDAVPPNRLEIRIQPHEGISLELRAKKPGLEKGWQSVDMEFCYSDLPVFNQHTAYEQLIVHAIEGDRSLFPGSYEVVQNWKTVQPLLDKWQKDHQIASYPKGSWGPKGADELRFDTKSGIFSFENEVKPIC